MSSYLNFIRIYFILINYPSLHLYYGQGPSLPDGPGDRWRHVLAGPRGSNHWTYSVVLSGSGGQCLQYNAESRRDVRQSSTSCLGELQG